MRTLLLIAGLAGFVQEATAQTPEPVGPDSTYLALTLELPVHGTFFVTRHGMKRKITPGGHDNTQERSYHYLDRVDLAACRMTWYRRMGGSPASATKYDIPLKSIDIESIKIRQLPGATLELPAWEITAQALDRSQRPFVSSRRGIATKGATNELSIPIVDRERADRFSRLLKDAATRCETWNTSPMRPIR